ncbi:MAG: efflux RND transporter periplasmic adaptor subunit [Shimia sp.]|nr:efflux RND transporter periplasmic adaptor subunit [Shimia sp.]
MNLRPLMIVPPLAIAVLGVIWMNREAPTITERPEETSLAVRTLDVIARPVVAEVTGYGRVTPEHEWSAVAEVQGRVERIPGALAEGSIVEQGAVLIAIDVTDHELSRQKAAANISAVQAQMTEITRQEENTRRSLALEQQTLDVAQAEFQRISELVARGASTQAALDTVQKTLLAQSNAVLSLENALALYPAQRENLDATLAVRQSELREAERAVEKATIRAPFAGRVSKINVEVGQFARAGDTLVTLDDTSAVEVIAEIQPSAFMPIFASTREVAGFDGTGEAGGTFDTSKAVDFLRAAGVSAEVRLTIGGYTMLWPAEIVRMRGTLDQETSTLGMVVKVNDPTIGDPSLRRARLDAGAFVAVDFRSKPIVDTVTVPRDAVNYDDDGKAFVYLVGDENRLAMAHVDLGPALGADVMVFRGLENGDRVVLSAPAPPILGMALLPIPAESSGTVTGSEDK